MVAAAEEEEAKEEEEDEEKAVGECRVAACNYGKSKALVCFHFQFFASPMAVQFHLHLDLFQQ